MATLPIRIRRFAIVSIVALGMPRCLVAAEPAAGGGVGDGVSPPPAVAGEQEPTRAASEAGTEEETAAEGETPAEWWQLLDSVEAPPPGRAWEGQVGFALLADGNPRLVSEALADALALGQIDPGAGESSDAATSYQVHLARQPAERLEDPRNRWQRALSLDAYQSLYREVTALDLTELQAAFHLARGRSPLGVLTGPLGSARVPVGSHRVSWLIQAGASRTLLDGEGYLRILEASASLLLRNEGAPRATQLELHLRHEAFDEEPAVGRRSGAELRLTAREHFLIGREDRFVRLDLSAGRRGGGEPWQRWIAEGGVALVWPLGSDWTLAATGTARFDRFDHRASDLFNPELILFDPDFDLLPEVNPDARRRDDLYLRGMLALAFRVWRNLHLVARASYTDRDSNLEPPPELELENVDLDYQRTLVSLGVSWSF